MLVKVLVCGLDGKKIYLCDYGFNEILKKKIKETSLIQ
jgi:hypothetical protein